MPRKDRTFRHSDVIRIYEYHLDSCEKNKVKAYFALEFIEDIAEQFQEILELIDKILEFIELLEKNPRIQRLIKRFRAILALVELAKELLSKASELLLGILEYFQEKIKEGNC